MSLQEILSEVMPLPPEPSFSCSSKGLSPLLLISGHNKDGFTKIQILCSIKRNSIGSALAWHAVPICLLLQAMTHLLESSKGWRLQGESLRNPADHMQAILELICIQCSVNGVWDGTQAPPVHRWMPNVLLQPMDQVLCQAEAETGINRY